MLTSKLKYSKCHFETSNDLVEKRQKSKDISLSLRHLRFRKSHYESMIYNLYSNGDNSKLSRRISRKIDSLNICIHLLENKRQRLRALEQ